MRLITKILIFCILALSPFFAKSQGNEFLLGKVAFEKKDYQQAIIHLSNFLNSFPKYDKARILRVESNLALANYSKNVDDLSEIRNSKDGVLLLLTARTYAGLGDNRKAFENLNLYKTANNKIPDEIIKSFPEFEALKSDPEWKRLWESWKYSEKENALVDIKYALKSKKIGEASDRLDQFLLKYKSNAEAYYLRGNLYFSKKDYKSALDCYESAVVIENSNLNYILARASANLKLKKEKKALEDYNMVINKDSLVLDAYLGRAETYLALVDYQRALNDVSRFRTYYPDSTDALFIDARVNVKLGDYLSAIGDYGKLIKTNPGNADYFIGRGDAYSETKTYAYAIKDYSMALDLDPKNSDVYKKKAKAFQMSGNLKNACIEWDHAAKLGDVESMSNLRKFCQD